MVTDSETLHDFIFEDSVYLLLNRKHNSHALSQLLCKLELGQNATLVRLGTPVEYFAITAAMQERDANQTYWLHSHLHDLDPETLPVIPDWANCEPGL